MIWRYGIVFCSARARTLRTGMLFRREELVRAAVVSERRIKAAAYELDPSSRALLIKVYR